MPVSSQKPAREQNSSLNQPDYLPIRDYALVGNCHGCALVARNGCVDWCCLERFDASPVFCRLLDAHKGGCFSIRPAQPFDVERHYVGDTNVLCMTFHTKSGRCSITDFMPVGRSEESGEADYVNLNGYPWLVRIAEGLEGTVPMEMWFSPSVGFGRERPPLHPLPGGVAIHDGPTLYSPVAFEMKDQAAEARFELRSGQRQAFVLSDKTLHGAPSQDSLVELREIAEAFWREWSAQCRYDGQYRAKVMRSALVLKLLSYTPTGAVVAAATTSLPEAIGGVRNWDYRYCWMRDAAQTINAFSLLGYAGEARRFSDFLYEACRCTKPGCQIMYAIDGGADLTEHDLEHLEGYRGSRPVRVGNDAHRQRQHDTYGEILNYAWLYHTLGGKFAEDKLEALLGLSQVIRENWEQPDHGFWEVRGEPRQFVFGKIMCWVALANIVALSGDIDGDGFAQTRDRIEKEILRRGVHPTERFVRQTFDKDDADATALLAPMMGFPLQRDIFEATVRRIQQRLQIGDMVYRYHSSDNLPGDEGAFMSCSFWLVDALLMLDRGEEAIALFERLVHHANDVGLYSEEMHPESGEFLGNFPQALTHLSMIRSATHIEIYKQEGAQALWGTDADRARMLSGASEGMHAVWDSLRDRDTPAQIPSSKKSVLAPR